MIDTIGTVIGWILGLAIVLAFTIVAIPCIFAMWLAMAIAGGVDDFGEDEDCWGCDR